MRPDYEKLKQNIMDVIEEEQIKLGYKSETIRLYYPLDTLNRFLGLSEDAAGMQSRMEEFAGRMADTLGELAVTHEKKRFCIKIPPDGVDYVHAHANPSKFIYDLIKTISRHGVSMEEVLEQFRRHSDHVHVEQMTNGEFDLLVYFEDGIPDDYRYCFTDEGVHVTYHRFAPQEYRAMFE